MIQDIAPHQLFNHYDPQVQPEPDSIVFYFDRSQLLVTSNAERLPIISELPPLAGLIYLFRVDETSCFLLQEETVFPEGFRMVSLNTLREQGFGPRHLLYAAMTAKHLADWYADNRFCGRCGQPRVHDALERCMVCNTCGNRSYPRIMPAVIVGVTNGNKLLLTRYKSGYAHNAMIAGFVEIGETVEEAVAREVMEEAGLRVKNIRYYKSQPWGIANDILMGYYCDVDGSDAIKMDQDELKCAAWTAREDIVLQPDDLSLTNEMMLLFRDGRI